MRDYGYLAIAKQHAEAASTSRRSAPTDATGDPTVDADNHPETAGTRLIHTPGGRRARSLRSAASPTRSRPGRVTTSSPPPPAGSSRSTSTRSATRS
jgi:hypothetical protein